MKRIISILLFTISISSCNSPEVVLETNIFLIQSKVEKDNRGGLNFGIQKAEHVYFNTQFWSLLLDKYPHSSELIFTNDTLHSWGVSTFSTSGDKNIEPSKEYRVRTLDSALLSKINKLLPFSVRNNEKDGTISKNYKGSNKEYNINTYKIIAYSRFKQLLTDSSYNQIEIFCDKSTLEKIIGHKYVQ